MNQPVWWNVTGGFWSLLRRACLTCPLGPWDFCAFERVHQTFRLKNQYVRTPQTLPENQETLVRRPTQRKNEIAEIIFSLKIWWIVNCDRTLVIFSLSLSLTHIDRHMHLPKVYGFLPKASALFKPWGLRPGWWCLFFSNLTSTDIELQQSHFWWDCVVGNLALKNRAHFKLMNHGNHKQNL